MIADLGRKEPEQRPESAGPRLSQDAPRCNVVNATQENVGKLLSECRLVRADLRQWLGRGEFPSTVSTRSSTRSTRSNDAPAEWSQQFEALGLNPQ